MFSRGTTDHYGLLIDIGSGSVGLAVCHSAANQKKPHIVWKQRSHVPLRNIASVADSSKAIITTLMHSIMEFESNGRPALTAYNSKARISTILATVAAPWSYTTTRTIRFEQDKPFAVTEDLVADLSAAAGEQAISEFNEQHSLESLGIAETSRCALDCYANGYRLDKPNKQLATQVSLTHATTLVQTDIITAIEELSHKLFGAVELDITSYMLANYFTTRLLIPHVYDVCLVDITNEATEIGIVRDGSLTYSTHTAFGRASLAREIAVATNTPLHEAFTSFPDLETIQAHPELQAIFKAYTQKVTQLFTETGDRLTIPKNIYLETDTGLETFFSPLIKAAAETASKGTVQLTTIKNYLQTQTDTNQADTPLLVSASFFHTHDARGHFEYL